MLYGTFNSNSVSVTCYLVLLFNKFRTFNFFYSMTDSTFEQALTWNVMNYKYFLNNKYTQGYRTFQSKSQRHCLLNTHTKHDLFIQMTELARIEQPSPNG